MDKKQLNSYLEIRGNNPYGLFGHIVFKQAEVQETFLDAAKLTGATVLDCILLGDSRTGRHFGDELESHGFAHVAMVDLFASLPELRAEAWARPDYLKKLSTLAQEVIWSR